MSLVCECRELEEPFGTSFTDRILEAREGDGSHPQNIKIIGRDQYQRIDRCSEEDRALVVLDIPQAVKWEKVWDAALDEGPRCMQLMKCLVKAL